MEQPSFYTVEQIARMMQVSEDTVRSWIKRRNNRLPSYRVGREFRIAKDDFDTFLKSQQYTDVDDNL
jgi:excisionase family DNA binding protein